MRRVRYTKLLVLLAFILVLSSCNYLRTIRPYALRQNLEHIIQIELLKRDDPKRMGLDEYEVIYTIPGASRDAFIQRFVEIDYQIPFGDGIATEFGSLAIRITYDNHDVEVIGITNNVYFTSDDIQYGSHYFDSVQFRDLFSQYVDISILPTWD